MWRQVFSLSGEIRYSMSVSFYGVVLGRDMKIDKS